MKKLKNEMCECGHLGGNSSIEQHSSRYAKGHGSCKKCDCKQFTWVKFVDEDGNDDIENDWKIDWTLEGGKERWKENDQKWESI